MVATILIADSDTVDLRATTAAVSFAGYKVVTATGGLEALKQIDQQRPDLIILDVMLPDVDGYETCRRLRRHPDTADLPVLMTAAQNSVEKKIKGFEAGADDFLTKPFEAVELLARVKVLLRHAVSSVRSSRTQMVEGKIVAVFSLRGGAGVTTLATNLAVSLTQLWGRQTILADLVPAASQDTLMLNLSPGNTWANLAKVPADEIDDGLVQSLLLPHPSGVLVLPAPRLPDKSQLLTAKKVSRVLSLLRERYHYVVLDLPHDLHEATVTALDASQDILTVMADDIASLATQQATLEVFELLRYPRNHVQLILNQIHGRNGLSQRQIESTLKRSFDLVVPFDTGVIEANNLGKPLVLDARGGAACALLEDFAFHLSKQEHRQQRPATPTKAWERVMRRTEHRQHGGLRRLFGWKQPRTA